MYRSILVPLDGSACAEQVLPYVRLLARLLDARVRLLHVLTEVDREGIIVSGAVSRRGAGDNLAPYREIERRAWELLRQQAEIYLAAQVDTLSSTELVVDTEVVIGVPYTCIVAAAERHPDTLIAVSTHGYGGLRRWALGSVTDKVVQTTAVPVLVVRSTAHAPTRDPVIRRIMVPLDGSDLARCVLPQAIALAQRAGAELIILRAVAPRTDYPGLLLMQRNQAAEALRVLAGELRQQQVIVTPVVAVDHASPAEAIVDEAAQRHVDLIVMATHGLGGMQRWVLGSVADKVLHATATPLLLMRAQVREQ